MARLTSLLSRILAFVLFALSWTRVAVARILPILGPAQEHRSVKVFALTEADWSALRAGSPVAAQEKSADNQQEKSKDAEQAKDSSKSEGKQDPAKSADCDQASNKDEENKGAEGKQPEAPKPADCQGPGGGDGDMGGTGG